MGVLAVSHNTPKTRLSPRGGIYQRGAARALDYGWAAAGGGPRGRPFCAQAELWLRYGCYLRGHGVFTFFSFFCEAVTPCLVVLQEHLEENHLFLGGFPQKDTPFMMQKPFFVCLHQPLKIQHHTTSVFPQTGARPPSKESQQEPPIFGRPP